LPLQSSSSSLSSSSLSSLLDNEQMCLILSIDQVAAFMMAISSQDLVAGEADADAEAEAALYHPVRQTNEDMICLSEKRNG
jgi:hypothetical protein